MKCELIDERPTRSSAIHAGTHFIDFCRGPHCPTLRRSSLQVLSIAGAYWKAVRRIAVAAHLRHRFFFTAKELDAHLKQIEEAKKRDHRKLGKDLDLFSIQELAVRG